MADFAAQQNWTDGVIVRGRDVYFDGSDDIFIYVSQGTIHTDYILENLLDFLTPLPPGTLCLNATNLIPMAPTSSNIPRVLLECSDQSSTISHRYVIIIDSSLQSTSVQPIGKAVISQDGQHIALYETSTVTILPADGSTHVVQSFSNLEILAVAFIPTLTTTFLEVLLRDQNITLVNVTRTFEAGDDRGRHELPNSVICTSEGCLPHQLLLIDSSIYMTIGIDGSYYTAQFYDLRCPSNSPTSVRISTDQPELVRFEQRQEPIIPPSPSAIPPTVNSTPSHDHSSTTSQAVPPFHSKPSPDPMPQPRGSKTSNPELGVFIGSAVAFTLVIAVLVFASIACIRIWGQKKKMRVTTTTMPESGCSQMLQTERGTPVGENDSGIAPSTRSASPEATELRELHADGSQSTSSQPPTVLSPATAQTQTGFVSGFGFNFNP